MLHVGSGLQVAAFVQHADDHNPPSKMACTAGSSTLSAPLYGSSILLGVPSHERDTPLSTSVLIWTGAYSPQMFAASATETTRVERRSEMSFLYICIVSNAGGGNVMENAKNTQVQPFTPVRVKTHRPRTSSYLAPACDDFIDPHPGTHSSKYRILIWLYKIWHIALLRSPVQTPTESPTRS